MVQLIEDPCFPHIGKALNQAYMQAALRTFLQSYYGNRCYSIDVISCTLKNKRYKPGKNFVCCYELEMADSNSKSTWQQTISARLCKSGNSQLELYEEQQKITEHSGSSSPVLFLPELEMMLWLFPHDRKLIHLANALDKDYLLSQLTELLPSLGCAAGSKISDVTYKVLHYLPERSCMIRYWLDVIEPSKPETTRKIIYGKNYRDNRGGEIFSVMRQLYQQLPNCAIPLAYDDQNRTLWQSHISGEPLTWDALQNGNAQALLTGMANCLVLFQQCQISTSETYGFAEIEEQLRDTVRASKPQNQYFSEQINAWVEHLLVKRHDIFNGSEALTPLHQDLHLGNFMIDHGMASLIDLDSVCIGNPLADIASLVTNFYRNGLQAGTELEYIHGITKFFLNLYAKHAPGRVNYPQLNWFIAAAFIHEVIRRLYRQSHEAGLKHVQSYFNLSKHYLFLIDEVKESASEAQ